MRRVRTTAAAAALAAALAPRRRRAPERAGAAGTGAAGTGAAGTGALASPLVPLPAHLVARADPAVQFRPAYRCAGPPPRRGRCAYVIVPLDHAKPDGRKIKIAISVLCATAPTERILGVLLVHPGGPVRTGSRSRPRSRTRSAPSRASRWNIVGVDPRGINGSRRRRGWRG